jgi:TonB-linked SusC/RagA family outer membrane protein
MKQKTEKPRNRHLTNLFHSFFRTVNCRQKGVRLFLICMLLIIGQNLFAQQITVTGTVTDKSNEPLIGVTVYVVGSNKGGVITDLNGNYTISAPSNATLRFAYLGMQPVNEKVNGRKTINITMAQDKRTSLDEVVVSVGYGQVKKRDLTGSVGQANMEEVSQAPVVSLADALAGRIAGLNVITADGAPGSESTVTVRGGGLSQDASPLFIIDGFPIENFNLNTLDPRNIKSIEVLKDASSIAIYGSRGANGVVIINTLSASKGKPQIKYNYGLSFNTRPHFVKMMNTYDYVKLQLELDGMDGRDYSINRYLGEADETTGIRPRTLDYYKTDPGTDWQKAVTQTGITQNHFLTLSGSNGTTKYIINGGYLTQDALVKKTGMDRLSFSGNLEQKFGKNIVLQLNANYTHTKTDNNSAFNRARTFFPTTGLKSTEEFISELEYMLQQGTLTDSGVDYGSLITPLQQANNEMNRRFQDNVQLGAHLIWNVLKYFTITPTIQYNTTGTEVRQFYNSQTSQGNLFKRANGSYANSSGINAYKENDKANSYLAELLINYNRRFGKYHNINAMYGFDYQYSELTQNSYKIVNIAPEFAYLGYYSIMAGALNGSAPTYYMNKNQLVSSFGRINYSYKDKYLLTLTGRYDGSSKLAKGHQWGFFPSGAVAWRFTSEPFMKSLKKVVNDGKLRMSYGQVGNNRGVNDFSYLVEFGALQTARQYMLDGKSLSNGLYQYFLANKNLTWEKATEFDLGMDLNLFDNRLIFSIDYYNKIVDGLLMPRKAPYYLGYANNTRYENAGSTQSKGLEISIISTNIKNKNFEWDTNMNISFNQNKVRSFTNGYDVMTMGNSGFLPNDATWMAIAGKSISQFFGYKYVRLYQMSDFYPTSNGQYQLKPGVVSYGTIQGGYRVQPGDPMYADLNGDGKITDADRTTLGSPIPKVTGGISNTFTYQNFSLNLFFEYSLGGKIVDFNRVMFETTGSYNRYSNQYASYANRWTPENTNTDIPRLMRPTSKGDPQNTSGPKLSSRLVEKGDYIRFATLSFIYRIPRTLLRKLPFSDASLSFAAQNLFVITPYKGQDPVVNSFNTYAAPKGIGYNVLTNSNTYTSMTGGLDNSPYPRARIFNFGLSLTF